MKLTQKNFDLIIQSFNHTTTKIKNDLKWMKWIMGYMATVITGIFVGGILIILKS